jgi:formate-dependent nitrite reductase membrane component NrfD
VSAANGADPQGASPDSYYGSPIINLPVWEEREIAGYLFLGGLAGGSSILAAAADAAAAPRLRRRARLAAGAAISLSFAALIKDLGRPARFVNMLRVLKPTSPMSVGTWLLSGYAPLAYGAAAGELSGRAPRIARAAGAGAGLLGSTVATYTAALIADTAVPAWHEGHRELPFLFGGSAAAAAGGLGLLAGPREENEPARRMAVVGGTGELIAHQLFERRLGLVAPVLHEGVAGRRLRAARALTVGGTILAAAGGRRHRLLAGCAGAALVSGSALTRFGLFAAGMQSARDPRYTVELQRRRRVDDQRSEPSSTASGADVAARPAPA